MSFKSTSERNGDGRSTKYFLTVSDGGGGFDGFCWGAEAGGTLASGGALWNSAAGLQKKDKINNV